ncbi:hypothetical protein [Chryseobacterium sp. SIMBA_038]|uniref:hypothetical protein n=1 Tax=Chryseobacterium sp. SIMBA_038 TaxID=3085780 RepID=UPI00397DBDB8
MKKTFILSAIAFCSIIEAQYCTPTFQYGVDGNTSQLQYGSTPVRVHGTYLIKIQTNNQK